jgi:ATP-dependent RNA helicase RhlE
MSLENLKLSKQLLTTMLEAGFYSPTEIQSKTISRIIGGQNLIAIAPKGTGKTTAYLLSVLHRLKGPVDGAPRALIIVPAKEKVQALVSLFKWLGKDTGLRVSCLAANVTTDLHTEAIEDGLADIIIGTPDKVNALYIKSSLNLRALLMFVVDDAETIVKLGQQALVYQLSDGIAKAQRLLYTEKMDEKQERLSDYIMIKPERIEVSRAIEKDPDTIPQILYQVPNYKGKIALLEYIIREEKSFSKAVLFMNNRVASEVLYKTLKKRVGNSIGILKHISSNDSGFDSMEKFKQSKEARIIVLSVEDQPSFNLLDIQYILHFELPDDKEIFIKRIRKISDEKVVAVTLATNNEVVQVKKIEQATKKIMQIVPLPTEVNKNTSEEEDISSEKDNLKGKINNGGEEWDIKIK